MDIDYTNEEQIIAFNYKYILEALKNIESDEIEINMYEVLLNNAITYILENLTNSGMSIEDSYR